MLKCPRCNTNTTDTHPFIRMDKPGPKAVGIFWCEPCAEKSEPELYRNQKEDEGDVEKLLKKWSYGEKE